MSEYNLFHPGFATISDPCRYAGRLEGRAAVGHRFEQPIGLVVERYFAGCDNLKSAAWDSELGMEPAFWFGTEGMQGVEVLNPRELLANAGART